MLLPQAGVKQANKEAPVFFAFSVPVCVYLYFCLPEMKGRTYLELQEMFQNRVPARKFRTYQCTGIDGITHKAEADNEN